MSGSQDQIRHDVEQVIGSVIEQVRRMAVGLTDLVQEGVEDLVERTTGQAATLEHEAVAMFDALAADRAAGVAGRAAVPSIAGPPEMAVRTSMLIEPSAASGAAMADIVVDVNEIDIVEIESVGTDQPPRASTGSTPDGSPTATSSKAKRIGSKKKATTSQKAKTTKKAKASKKSPAKKSGAKKSPAKKSAPKASPAKKSQATGSSLGTSRAARKADPRSPSGPPATEGAAGVGASGVGPILTRNPNK